MHPENKIIKCKKLDLWLGGLSLDKKLETLECGKLVTCLKCNKTFFDRESPEERQSKKCKPASAKHECIEDENYIILNRGFTGIRWVVNFPDSVRPKTAIVDHFVKRNKKRGR